MHFSVIVILKKGQKLDKVMAPFYSGDSVPSHPEKCYCISDEAKSAVRGKLNFDTHVRIPYGKLPAQEQTQGMWKKMVAEHNAKEIELIKAHPRFGQPDPACSECEGTGTRQSESNPQGYWDWYEVGGRWQGFFANKKGKSVDRLKMKDLSLEKMELINHQRLIEQWDKIQEKIQEADDQSKDRGYMDICFGYEGEKTFQE